ncbi:hypothetical protein D3C77_143380 [compost metagenome]
MHAAQLTLDHHVGGDFLAAGPRQVADAARGDLGVLSGDCLIDVVGGEVEADQLLRIKPDAHSPFRAIQLRFADTLEAADLVHDVARQEVAQGHLIQRAILRGEGNHQEKAGGEFLNLQALLGDGPRQP